MQIRMLLAALAVVTVIPTAGLAEKLELAPEADTYLSSMNPTANYNTSPVLWVQSDLTEHNVWALLRFDVSNLPDDADINLAYLYLYDANGNTSDAGVYEVTSGWIPNAVNWNDQPTYNSTAIGALEGYFDSGWRYVDLTSYVRDWHAGTRSNNGVIITGGSLNLAPNPRNFHSKENPTNPAKLVIIYDSDSVRLWPTDDAHVSFADSMAYFGSSETLAVQERGIWSFLRFDPSAVPAGATIEYARVRMYHYGGSGLFGSFPVGAHLVEEDWDESAINWHNKPDHARWPAYVDGNLGPVFAGGENWIDLNVTSYVQTWHTTPSTNNGVMVGDPTDPGTGASGAIGYFRSGEYATEGLRPYLEVFYETPTPNSFGTPTPLMGLRESDAAWADWDNDGDLDLVLCGETGSGCVTKTYENAGDTLIEVPNTIPGIKQEFSSGSVAWADYDNDGDLDLSLAGYTGSSYLTRIYVNDGTGAFTDSVTTLPNLRYASLAWGDYDNDGDLDLFIQGTHGVTVYSHLYRNDGGMLVLDQTISPAIYGGTADWADWDGDGDLDLLTTGSTGAARRTYFHRNDGGTFTNLGNRGLPDVCYSDVAWADYDRDGDLDLALVGQANLPSVQNYTRIYSNDGDGNLEHAWWLLGSAPQLRLGGCAWGDYDNDGRLDLAVCGYDESATQYTQVYHNDDAFNFT
ncbi:MAG: DNRLRE domain-containing protein, partial [Candidatus Latescibacterota bacterium]